MLLNKQQFPVYVPCRAMVTYLSSNLGDLRSILPVDGNPGHPLHTGDLEANKTDSKPQQSIQIATNELKLNQNQIKKLIIIHTNTCFVTATVTGPASLLEIWLRKQGKLKS